ncbi:MULTISPECIES: hypothetical protein [Pseudomonas]|uniref:Uncharacterized protein n=1 Tax=Pseudomonas auratipiscis TaxID=3115853 RepID=A0AB35WUX4_9PSED|nr:MULTISPECIES: hypothetical protein [unclassified Pseudomonas]MEE1867916.1 hypothetical protein [Pseudomonas sp. 120P]MEE1959500.1 hypothetical protein [Pseudomonas sp. 119P]
MVFTLFVRVAVKQAKTYANTPASAAGAGARRVGYIDRTSEHSERLTIKLDLPTLAAG